MLFEDAPESAPVEEAGSKDVLAYSYESHSRLRVDSRSSTHGEQKADGKSVRSVCVSRDRANSKKIFKNERHGFFLRLAFGGL